MKKIIILMMALLATSVMAAYAPPELMINLLRYEPSPAEPGQQMEIWLVLSNKGTQLENIKLKLEPEYPFTPASGQALETTIPIIPTQEDLIVKYRILIDTQAENLEKNITFQYTYGQNAWMKTTFPITIKSREASLSITGYETKPASIAPGQKAKLYLELENNGRSELKNIKITLEENQNLHILGTGNQRRIDYLGIEQYQKLEFDVITDTGAQLKVQTLPVKLEYTDAEGKEYVAESKISVPISATPELIAVIDDTDLTQAKKSGSVDIMIINKGIANTKYLTVTLEPNDNQYEITSPTRTKYLGNLDSDDFETATFNVDAKKTSIELKTTITFKDDYNQDHTIEYVLPLKLPPAKKSSTLPIVIILIIIAVVVYWRIRKKKHAH